ncbi:MAG: hypothetical protein ABFS46_16105 [Myxococcota bacterium]
MRNGGTKMTQGMKNGTLVLASAAAGLLTLGAGASLVAAEEAEKVNCYGVNKCKGTGACGGKGHSCAGENACKGQGYLKIDAETCLKIQGGRLTPEPQGEAG